MFLLLSLVFLLLTNSPILASENIFGLHLTQTADIKKASQVINSTGGDWGWATIVIRTDQMDKNTWQKFFDNCRQKHITPIVRLSTIMDQNLWIKPQPSHIDQLASFLGSLNWPSQRQHIILFNEINHATEWGGTVNVAEFANLATYACQKFKSTNPNFYVLSMGLDLAAPQKLPDHASAKNVYRQISETNPSYFDCIDALSSHSYPNHGYVGKPTDTGQTSIRGYLWELYFLKSIGIDKTYPIFITETGWPHRQGQNPDNNYYTAKTGADFLVKAFNYWQTDSRIQAVTPFIYNYPNPPFDHFSWTKTEYQLYPEYQALVDLPKKQNQPSQITKFEIKKIKLPFIIFTDREYSGHLTLKNAGQSIWGKNETNFCLPPQTTRNVELTSLCTPDQHIQPGQSLALHFKFKIKSNTDHTDKTFLGWQKTKGYEITPIYTDAKIYRPKTGIRQKIAIFLNKLIK